MSFAKDLWDELELLDKHSLSQRKSAEEFLQLLRERALHEVFYARGLERIALHKHAASPTETLSPAIAAMKKACEERSRSSFAFAEAITVEMIEPISELLRSQALSVNRTSSEGQFMRRQLQALLGEHSDAYQCFQEACMVTDKGTYTIEQGLSTKERSQLISTLLQHKQKMEESEREYHASVKRVNDFKAEFDGTMVRLT
jgi:hypothetical protein